MVAGAGLFAAKRVSTAFPENRRAPFTFPLAGLQTAIYQREKGRWVYNAGRGCVKRHDKDVGIGFPELWLMRVPQ